MCLFYLFGRTKWNDIDFYEWIEKNMIRKLIFFYSKPSISFNLALPLLAMGRNE